MATIGYNESTASQSTTSPTWYSDLFKNLLQQGQTQAGRVATPYSGALTQYFTPEQQRAGQLVNQNVGAWQPTYQQGLGTTGGALTQTQQASQYNPGQLQQFMNPYIGGVVNEISRLGNLNLTENILPGIADQYTALGQFGSGRQGTALAQAAQRGQREISGAQAQALAGAYDSAAGQYSNWANIGLQGSQQAGALGQQQLDAAQQLQQQQLGDQQALFGYGEKAQQTQQTGLTNQYNEWLRQQQQPLAALGTWGNLFGAATPDQNIATGASSTQSSFKRGGLVQLAEGGEFDWQIDPETQRKRDILRRILLERERRSFPKDEALSSEIAREDERGNVYDALAARMDSDFTGEVPQLASFQDEEVPIEEEPIQVAQLGESNDITQAIMEGMRRRRELVENLGKSENFANIPEGDAVGNIGEAMMRSAAKGPASYGQLIGRTGESYFDRQDERRLENQKREVARTTLQEKLLDIPGVGRSSQPSMKLFRGKDGSQWALDASTGQTKLLYPGSYDNQINEMARKAATTAISDPNLMFRSEAERAAAFNRQYQSFRQKFASNYAGLGATIDAPGIPTQPLPSATGDQLRAGTSPTEVQGDSGVSEPTTIQSYENHPGVTKYTRQGLSPKAAVERFTADQKEYDDIAAEREKNSPRLSAQDLDIAYKLNEEIKDTFGVGTGPWFNVPYSTDIAGTVPGEQGKRIAQLDAIGTEMVPQLVKGLSPISDADIKAMKNAGFGSKYGYAVNEQNIKRAKSSLELFHEYDTFLNEAREMGLTASRAKVEWNKFIKANPMFDLASSYKTKMLNFASDPNTRRDRLTKYTNSLRNNFFKSISHKETKSKENEQSNDEVIEVTPEDIANRRAR